MAGAKKIRVRPTKARTTRRIDTQGEQPPRHPLWDRIVEYVDHGFGRGPIPRWMPQWIAEKETEHHEAEVNRNTEILHKLEEGGIFRRIEKEGGIPLPGEARGHIAIALACARMRPLGVFLTPKLQERQKLAKKAEALAAEIEAGLSSVDFLFDSPSKELPRLLREYAQQIGAQAREKGRPGRRAREQDDWVIEAMAEVYHRIGGRVAVSQTGPFAKVLKVVWEEALPVNNRSASAETFVRRAKLLLPKLREMTKRLPRGGGWP